MQAHCSPKKKAFEQGSPIYNTTMVTRSTSAIKKSEANDSKLRRVEKNKKERRTRVILSNGEDTGVEDDFIEECGYSYDHTEREIDMWEGNGRKFVAYICDECEAEWEEEV